MKIEELNEGCIRYKEVEGREGFYKIALEIVDKHPLHASLIILATWNNSRFRFMSSDPKTLTDFKLAIEKCMPLFERIKNEKLQAVNLDGIKDIVIQIYSMLSKVKGVEYTGASKVMHLVNRELFVMWDDKIRKRYHVPYNAEGFFEFQKLIQSETRSIVWNDKSKTLAKAIDEYNYVHYSIRGDVNF